MTPWFFLGLASTPLTPLTLTGARRLCQTHRGLVIGLMRSESFEKSWNAAVLAQAWKLSPKNHSKAFEKNLNQRKMNNWYSNTWWCCAVLECFAVHQIPKHFHLSPEELNLPPGDSLYIGELTLALLVGSFRQDELSYWKDKEFFVRQMIVKSMYRFDYSISLYPMVKVHGTVPKRWVNTWFLESNTWWLCHLL